MLRQGATAALHALDEQKKELEKAEEIRRLDREVEAVLRSLPAVRSLPLPVLEQYRYQLENLRAGSPAKREALAQTAESVKQAIQATLNQQRRLLEHVEMAVTTRDLINLQSDLKVHLVRLGEKVDLVSDVNDALQRIAAVIAALTSIEDLQRRQPADEAEYREVLGQFDTLVSANQCLSEAQRLGVAKIRGQIEKAWDRHRTDAVAWLNDLERRLNLGESPSQLADALRNVPSYLPSSERERLASLQGRVQVLLDRDLSGRVKHMFGQIADVEQRRALLQELTQMAGTQ